MARKVQPVAEGGTGATTAADARTNLAVPSADNAALTGTPTAPTAASGTNNTQIATTEFSNAAAIKYAIVFGG